MCTFVEILQNIEDSITSKGGVTWKNSRRPRPPGCEKVNYRKAETRKRNAQIRKSVEKNELFLRFDNLWNFNNFWYKIVHFEPFYLTIPFCPPVWLVLEKKTGRRLFFSSDTALTGRSFSLVEGLIPITPTKMVAVKINRQSMRMTILIKCHVLLYYLICQYLH